MMIGLHAPIFLLSAWVFVLTAITSAATTDTSLPNEVFWDNHWPSDLNQVDDDDDTKVLDFFPLENPYVISEQSELDSIADDPDELTAIFNEDGNDEVEVKTMNGGWVPIVYLPDASTVPNLSEFQLSCDSSYNVTVNYNNGDTSISVSSGNYLVLAAVEGAWLTEDEYNPTPNPPMVSTSEMDTTVLDGTVLFAQSHIIPSKNGIDGDSQPHLTALRKTLVMLRPHNIEDATELSLEMTVRDTTGTVVSLGPIEMKVPDDIPKHDGWIELGDTDVDDIEFPVSLEDPYAIQSQSNLDNIKDDEEAVFLTDIMNNENEEVEIETLNGSWVRDIYLPRGETIPADSKVQLICNSEYSVNMHYPNTQTGGWRIKTVSNGQNPVFILVNNIWLADLGHNEYIFGHGFFTATLEAEWVQQGMVLEFKAVFDTEEEEDKIGTLDGIKIGSVTELVITAIDVGFLTPPRDEFFFRNDETAQREYFETAPASRLIVAQYETLHLEEVMMPSGKLYTEVSDTDGGWHEGDMRQYTGKILISHGIDLANYGISSSKGGSESHPFTCALLAAHNTVGMYQNGRVVHGGSGGNGIVTLDSSIGNELSHEVGHNYGLGHFVGGFDGSVHRPSDKINSSWGWDSQKNIFVPNFDSEDSGSDTCLDGECQSPYLGKYRFGTDAMAGGSPMWGSNRFTLYTPHVAKIIQNFLESKAVWDPTSSTGFRKFDQHTKGMEEFVNSSNEEKVPRLYRVPVTTIVGYYDPSSTRGLADYVFPAMHGAYGFVYEDDSSSSTGTSDGCELRVKTRATSNEETTLVYTLTIEIYEADYMNKFHVNVATEDTPFKASIYCFDELRASRDLNAPNQDEATLKFAVHGIETPITNNPTQFPTNKNSMDDIAPANDVTIVCFSAFNEVDVQGRGVVLMDTVRVGDYVRVKNGHSRVHSIAHHDTDLETTFLQVHSHGLEKPLELTEKHLVFANNKIIRADQLKIGNTLSNGDEEKYVIYKIQQVKRTGVYAPITESGDIVVSGVRASSYYSLADKIPFNHHTLLHYYFAPRRLMCSYDFSLCEDETFINGYSKYAFSAISIMERVNEMSCLVQYFLSTVALLFLLFFYAFEQVIMIFSSAFTTKLVTSILLSRVVILVSIPSFRRKCYPRCNEKR